MVGWGISVYMRVGVHVHDRGGICLAHRLCLYVLWVHRGGKDAAILRGHSMENRGVGGGGKLGELAEGHQGRPVWRRKPPTRRQA